MVDLYIVILYLLFDVEFNTDIME